MEAWQFAAAYHEETKHGFRRMARSAGYMDWANQPDPFRRYNGCELFALSHSRADQGPAYSELYIPGAVTPVTVDNKSISRLFEYGLALSAWKEFRGTRWALRINPSSGNLHPTEGYLMAGPVEGLWKEPGVFHYAPKQHALERRAIVGADSWLELTRHFPKDVLFVGLSSVHWREAWKYGERAFRYCQHDVGHALAAVALSAALNGWTTAPLGDVGDDEIAAVLGLDRNEDFQGAEREAPDLFVAVLPSGGDFDSMPMRWAGNVQELARKFSWSGRANRLSAERVVWELIDAVEDACHKPITRSLYSGELSAVTSALPMRAESEKADISLPASMRYAESLHTGEDSGLSHATEPYGRRTIRQRRSAVAMDGRTSLSREAFFGMLDRTMPRFDRPPWRALGPRVYIHLGLFVHRVRDVAPGLYFLVRDEQRLAELRTAMSPSWLWEVPAGRPTDLPLFQLDGGDYTNLATQISCGQDIAGDGAFSCGMIAEFARPLRAHGAWMYRRLFWETGMIGQVLYLEAEAAGVRSTGIGCFFDDPVHDVFGIKDKAWQSLYHFTVGGPTEDTRLTTLPAYPGAPE